MAAPTSCFFHVDYLPEQLVRSAPHHDILIPDNETTGEKPALQHLKYGRELKFFSHRNSFSLRGSPKCDGKFVVISKKMPLRAKKCGLWKNFCKFWTTFLQKAIDRRAPLCYNTSRKATRTPQTKGICLWLFVLVEYLRQGRRQGSKPILPFFGTLAAVFITFNQKEKKQCQK